VTLEIAQLRSGAATSPVYRRRHLKADGREVLLYAYAPPDQEVCGDGLAAQVATSELRWHPFRHEWSIYAASRQERTYKPSAAEDPLAPARAGAAPTEIPFQDFDVAIFENRFPSLRGAAAAAPKGPPFTERAPARGRCEVVVYTPKGEGGLAELTQQRRELLVHAWIDRYEQLFAAGCEFVLPFENRGDEVGVTLHHPHGQIYGFSFTPAVQLQTVKAFEDGFDLAAAMKDWRADYAVAEAGGMLAFAPAFARFPYELWVASITPRRGPWEFEAEELSGFASLLGDVTRRYDAFFGRACPYMMSLHAAPRSGGAHFHFTAQFYPILRAPGRVKYLASVEQATNVFTVDIMPERTASELRGI
jgi:UDPglucose--hexose-1-phosphate uridylyltransferase